MSWRLAPFDAKWTEGLTEGEKHSHLVKGIKGCIEEANVLGQYVNEEVEKNHDFDSVYKSVQKALAKTKEEQLPFDTKGADSKEKEICPSLPKPDEEAAQW